MSFVLRNRFNFVYRELKHCILSTCPFRSNSTSSNTNFRRPYLRPAITGIGLGIVVGGVYSYFKIKENTDDVPDTLEPSVTINLSVKSMPSVQIARKITNPNDSSGLQVTLFQYPTCPFCCKVRAFLDYYGISYDVVEVNPVLRQQLKWSQYKKVPILLIKNRNEYIQLNDSTMIISSLMSYLKSHGSSIEEITQYYPSMSHDGQSKNLEILNKYFIMSGKLDENHLQVDKDERKWRRWADDVLVHTLSPNVYRTKEEALQAFNWFSEVGEWDRLFSKWDKLFVVYVGAFVMWMVGKKLKKKHNLKTDVRQSLYDECRFWIKEVNNRGQFFGGSSPNLADLAVYGVLSSIEGCHAFKDLLKNTNIGRWYNDMKQAVQNHSGNISSR